MNFQEIYDLTEYVPRNSRYFGAYRSDDSSDRSFEVSRFSICYSDLAFLWHFVKSFTDSDTPLPSDESGFQNHPCYDLILRIHAFETGEERDAELAHAISLDKSVPPFYKHVLQACLLADDASIDKIAVITGRPRGVIELYSKLFFDVLDRKNDAFLIAGIIYPETRAVEIDPNYITTVQYDALLKRTAKSGGLADTLTLAGVDVMAISGQTQAMASSFENKIMANADFMARIGALNSRDSVGVNNAKNLLAAAKHGGDTDMKSEDLMNTGFGASLMNEVMTYESDVLEERRQYKIETEEAEKAEQSE